MRRAEAWGVVERYQRADREWVDAPPETVQAVLATMGAADDRSVPPARGPLVAQPGGTVAEAAGAVVVVEDGGEARIGPDGTLPADVPFGYHRLSGGDAGERTLIVTPRRCLLPERRAWGWAAQLYAVRSAASWGIGDLADLRRLAGWSVGELGAGLLLVNPLHASLPGLPQTASPYFPSTRRFRNPLYLRVEEVPGAGEAGVDLDRLAATGRALNRERLIDRDEAYRLKLEGLEAIWARFGRDAAFEAYCRREGDSLEGYATFCALAEEHGRPWQEWPEQYRHPDGRAVAEYRRARQERVRFHMWLQWLLDVQLERASAEVPVIHDLAVGFDPAGADAWQWQDMVAADMSVGAPADEFNTLGQDWGVPPFDPWKLRAADYAPFVQTVRSALRHGGGMRLDHVMGLFRLFWVPRGGPPSHGTYVRYPADDLLDVVAVESHRAGAYVVGEDLGTVEDRVREELADRNVLSYRLLFFEEDRPARWPPNALAAVTTHDLPTVTGLWQGSDLKAQRELGLEPNEESTARMRAKLGALATVEPEAEAEPEVIVDAAYAALSEAPCLLLAATLDDALGVEERPNMPGTIDQWPNWSIALPVPLEKVEGHPGPRRLADRLRRPE